MIRAGNYKKIAYMRSKGLTIREIRKHINLSVNYIARIIDELAKKGYVDPLPLLGRDIKYVAKKQENI
jgi:hypothetical protein